MIEEIFLFIIGLCFGSFFSSLFFRFKKKPLLFSRSHCPHCFKKLSFLDLIPLFSFLFLKGACRYCRKKISLFYPLFELFSGLLFLFAFFLAQNFFHFIFLAFVFSSLLLIFFFDLREYQIPDLIVVPLIIVIFLYLYFQLPLKNLFFFHFLPSFLLSLFFFALFYFSKGEMMGENDSKLIFALALFLGSPRIFCALFFTFLSGFLISLFLIFFKKKGLKTQVPFAPFLIFGFFFNLALPSFPF
ncbi:MAG: prepilin peptidase [Minisyncoccales bacterium]